MALFSDNFNRADSSSVGGDWTEVDAGGYLSIYSNALRCNGGTDNFALIYVASSQNNNIKITFSLNIVSLSSDAAIVVTSKSGGTDFDSGYGIKCYPRSSNPKLYWSDEGLTANETAFTFEQGKTYNFEIIINTDYSGELRVWESTGARPDAATLSHAAETPTAAGTNYQIGFNAKRQDFRIDDFVVEDLTPAIAKHRFFQMF